MAISDVVILSDDERAVWIEDPEAVGATFHAKNIDPVVLSILGAQLGVGDQSDVMAQFDMVHVDEGGALLVFPPVLRDRIAALAPAEIGAVAARWAEVEEFRGAEAAPLEAYLTGLAAFFQDHRDAAYLSLGM